MLDADPVISYKPSAFYFRRAIRAVSNRGEAVILIKDVLVEFDLLARWADAQGIASTIQCPTGGDCKTLDDIKSVGLAAVTALEDLKAFVREHGAIPPKFRVLAEEARDKGWDKAAGA